METGNYFSFEPKSIFISRDLSETSILKNRLQYLGYSVTGCSLIKISQVRFTHVPVSDWIFFSSKNAITCFFAQNPLIAPETRYAVFGKSSAQHLQQFKRKAEFVGSGNDATAIAKDFARQIVTETVLFPQAIDSMQTVQKQLSFHNISKNLYVYKTEPVTGFSLPKTELLVFTSPSNVRAYFSKYTIAKDQKVIAIGTTTQHALSMHGVRNVAVPASFDEESILEKIMELSNEAPALC